MANNVFSQIYRLTHDNVNEFVQKGKPGNYILGHKFSGKLVPEYVGRDDVDLNKRLNTHAGNNKYRWFRYRIATSPKEAYEVECSLYHRFKGDEGMLDNSNHPNTPDGIRRRCPVNGCNHPD